MLNFIKKILKNEQPTEKVRVCKKCGFIWMSDRHWLCPDCHGIDTQVVTDWHGPIPRQNEKREA
jgi:rubrerythrin